MERLLAKEKVAGSSPVSRSEKKLTGSDGGNDGNSVGCFGGVLGCGEGTAGVFGGRLVDFDLGARIKQISSEICSSEGRLGRL